MKKLVIVFSFVIFAGSFAHADDQSSGCGLGWQITKRNSLVSSTIRSWTNYIASNTSGMTSGTSGCAKHTIVMKNKEALYYAEANYLKLQSEMAEGKGEHIQAFAKVMGCNEQAAAAVGAVLQSNYGQIFTSDSVAPYEMLDGASRAVFSSDVGQAGCLLGV